MSAPAKRNQMDIWGDERYQDGLSSGLAERYRLREQNTALLAALEALYNDCYLTGPVDTVAQARAAIKGAKQ